MRRRWLTLLLALAASACDPKDPIEPGPDGGAPLWRLVQKDLPGALLSIWSTSPSDVWMVGGDARDGSGPMVVHYDGTAWERLDTGLTSGDFWWVFGFANGPMYMGGAGGKILRYEGGTFMPMTTPSIETVFGIWGASPDDLWAVGGASDNTGGFAWRLTGGDTWTAEASLPVTVPTSAALWKVYGKSASDAWLVGSNGVSLHWDGTSLSEGDTGVGSSLFTVHANAQRYAAVGGLASGILVENEGAGWIDRTPADAINGLTGVCLNADDTGYAVGQYASVFTRDAEGWHKDELGLSLQLDLHSVWIDPSGGVWAVGGVTASVQLTDGLVLHKGDAVAEGGI